MQAKRQHESVPSPSLEEFFSELFPPNAVGFVELRALPGPIQDFVPPDDVQAIERFVRTHRDKNVFFGVATRRTRGNGSLANCSDLGALWLDVDFKTIEPDVVVDRLLNFGLKPNIVVCSGAGYHIYWSLRQRVRVQEERERVRSILRRLARQLDADVRAAEPARILRMPGSLNHKYRPPRPVTIEMFERQQSYRLDDFERALPTEEPPTTTSLRSVPETVIKGERNDVLYRLARSLRAKGVKESAMQAALPVVNVEVCSPPLDADEVEHIAAHAVSQTDREDFRRSGAGSDSFLPLKKGAGKESKFRPRSVSEIFSEPAPRINWLWERFLPTGALTLLVGYMKSGKTTLVYRLAIAIAQGEPFLGFKTERGGVLILALEEHRRDWHRRLLQFGARRSDPISVHGGLLTHSNETVEKLREFITAQSIKLVIVDTISRYWSGFLGDENANMEMMRAVNPFLDLAHETDTVVLFVHHQRKSGGDEGRGIRGASALFGLVDQALLLERRPGKERTQRLLRAFGRYSETPPELVIQLEGTEYRNCGTPEESDRLIPVREAFAALSDEPQDLATLAKKTGLSAKELRKILDDPDNGAVREGAGKRGHPFTYRLGPNDLIAFPAHPIGQERKQGGRGAAVQTSSDISDKTSSDE